jgi:uncharacterized protein (TIGR02757 family)
LGEHLSALYRGFPFDRSLSQDPLSCVRPYRHDRWSAEVAGLFAATLAIGTTTSIRGAFHRLERIVGGNLVEYVDSADPSHVPLALAGFRHRWIRGDQLQTLASTLRVVRETEGSVEEVFVRGYEAGGFPAGLDRLAKRLRDGPSASPLAVPRGYRALFPSPFDPGHSACKRLTLFVRWMVRPEYPDLGVWSRVPLEELRIPLDHHVFWIAYHLGLTQRKTRNWATVEEVTSRLRRLDGGDPVKYDFVLCHTGISGDCPKARDERVCGPCVVRPDCLLWRGASRTPA